MVPLRMARALRLVFPEVGLVVGAAEVEVALAGRVIVVETQVPFLQPFQGALAVVGETAVDTVAAAELATRLPGADGPLVAPGHVNPGIPTADRHRRILFDCAELRCRANVAQVPILASSKKAWHCQEDGQEGEDLFRTQGSHQSGDFSTFFRFSVCLRPYLVHGKALPSRQR